MEVPYKVSMEQIHQRLALDKEDIQLVAKLIRGLDLVEASFQKAINSYSAVPSFNNSAIAAKFSLKPFVTQNEAASAHQVIACKTFNHLHCLFRYLS